MKKCVCCQVEQPLSSFTKRALSPDGLAIYCKSCVSVQKRARRDALRLRSDEEVDAAAVARGPRACTRCGEVKEPDEFPRDRGRSDGRGQYCKVCARAAVHRWRRETHPDVFAEHRKAEYGRNRETYRRSRLKNRFGITLEQYHEMLALQGSKCAICNQIEGASREGRTMHLAVDHDHETGEVRALLCGNCNKGLGNFQDSPELLASAILYLSSHRLRAVQ